MVSRLDRVSSAVDSSRTAVVREAVQAYLVAKEREMLAEEMSRYACEMADVSGDFVAWSGPEADAMLQAHTEW